MQCRYDELLLELWMDQCLRMLTFFSPNAFLSLLMNCKFHLYNVQVLLVRTCFIGKQQLWDHLTVPMLAVFS